MTLTAPFPWFGGKRRAAEAAWGIMGNPDCYVEPFGGSAAVLLARPGGPGKIETYNDADGLLCNAWRAMASDADGMARLLDWPVSEADLHARHIVLVESRESVTARLEADPRWYDLELAAWWVWGACCWIGSGWCSGSGPWVRGADGLLERGNTGQGIRRQLPHLGNAGRGIHRQPSIHVREWMRALQDRLRRVRVTCGDWARVITPAVVERHGIAAVFLDPPYPEGWTTTAAYAGSDGCAVALWDDVRAAAVDLANHGVRVVVCGYSGTWDPPSGWSVTPWLARNGYAKNDDRRREVLFHANGVGQVALFGGAA